MSDEGRPRRRRKRWVVIVLLLLALGGAAILVLNRLRGKGWTLYQKGEIYLEAGRPRDAIDAFQRALAEEPEHIEAQIGLVRAYALRRDFAGASAELEKAARIGVGEARRGLLMSELLAAEGQYRLHSAGETADAALCDAVLAEFLRPAIQTARQHAERAPSPAEAYTQIGHLCMQESATLARKWRLLGEQRDRARVLGHVDEAAAIHGDAVAVIPEVGRAQAAGVEAYRRAIELDPDLAGPRLALARHLLGTFVPRPAEARKVLNPILEDEPDHRSARILMCEAARAEGDYDEALKQLRAAERIAEDDPVMLTLQTQVLVEAERWQEAAPHSEQLIQRQPDHLGALYLRGQVLLSTGHPEEAATLLQSIFARTSDPWPQARFALAEALRARGVRQQAIDAYRRTLDDLRQTLLPTARLAERGRRMKYESHKALAEELADEEPSTAADQAAQALAVMPHRDEAYELADRLAREAEQPLPRREELGLLHAGGLAAAGKMPEAVELLRTRLEGPAGGLRTGRMLARLLAREGAFRELVELYRDLMERFPGEGLRYELAALHVRLRHFAEARKVYEEALEANPRDLAAITGLFGLLARIGDAEGARAVLEQAEEVLDPQTVRAFLMGLYLREGRLEEAIALAQAQVQATPEQARVHVVLAELLWRDAELDAARASFERALEADADHLPAYGRALLDLQQGRPEQAVALLERAHERFPGQIASSVTYAVALQAAGQPERAGEVLDEVFARSEIAQPIGDALHWYGAVIAAGQGDLQTALAHSEAVRSTELGFADDRARLLSRLSGADEARRRQAAAELNMLVALRRAASLAEIRQKVESIDVLLPGEPLVECWYADVLDGRGEHEEAVERFGRIMAGFPDLLFARLRLAESHARHAEQQEAVAVLQEALPLASARQVAVIHLRLGQLYEGMGQIDAAVSSYQAAMQSPAVAALAANNLAYLTATQKGDPAAALPLARQALRFGGPIPQVLDTLGWVHYLNGEAEEAIQYLEAARRGMPGMPTLRYHLAMAYLKTGRREEARRELEEALSLPYEFPEAQEAMRELSAL